MYELSILGELMDGPIHGYTLHQIVEEVIGPIRQMSWSMLYPLLRHLEDRGLIVREGDSLNKSSKRERKRYLITPAGKARFHVLMVEPGAYNVDYPDLFTIKMSNFHHISSNERVVILEHYRGYIHHIQDYLLTHRQHVVEEPRISEAERPYLLRTLDHRVHLLQADLDWLDTEIQQQK